MTKQKRTENLNIRVTKELYTELEFLAEADDRTVSAYSRRLLELTVADMKTAS